MTHSPVSIAISLLFVGSALIGIFKMLVQVFRSAPVEVAFRFLSRKTESKAMKQKQELIRRKEAQEKRLAEQERIRKHYEYKNEIKLNIVIKDRHFLFGSQYDQGWDYDPQKYNFAPTSQGIRNLCFLMFAEMAGRKIRLLKDDPTFWNAEKESYWRKICPRAVLQQIPSHEELIRLKMERQALADSDSLDHKKVC